MKRIILTLLVGSLCLLNSCFYFTDECVKPDLDMSGDKALIEKLRSESTDTLVFSEGKTYVLGAVCYEGISSDPDSCNSGISSSLVIYNRAKNPKDEPVTVVKNYEIYQDSIWIKDMSYRIDLGKGSYTVGEGPNWPADSTIDIVAELKINNVRKYVIQRNVLIRRHSS